MSMDSLKDIVTKQQESSPTYFDEPEKDRMMSTILALSEEVCVLRDRLDTCRRLAEDGSPATDQNIDAFDVTDSLQQERLRSHTDFLAATFEKLQSGD